MHTSTQWTHSALDCVRRHGLEAAAQALVLPAEVQVDDLLELQGPRGPVSFIVRQRCWQAQADGALLLRIELDYPPRPSGVR